MLFDTIAEYNAEIAKVRQYLFPAMKEQTTVQGGPAQGAHLQRGNVREMKEYLEMLSKERAALLKCPGGMVTQVAFRRER